MSLIFFDILEKEKETWIHERVKREQRQSALIYLFAVITMTTLVMKDESVFKRFVVKFISYAFLSIIFALGNDVYASVQPETHGEIDSKFQMKDVKQFLEQKIRSLNTTELIVFGFIVILAFEILNFGSGHLSGKSRIEVVSFITL